MVIIIGAGLSGLLIAYRLKSNGIPFKVLEARSRLGGRIHTVNGTSNTPVEMGATWFYEAHENLISLLNELQLQAFVQKMDNTVFYQQNGDSPVQLMQIPPQAPSYRISGGTENLINTLYKNLDENDVIFDEEVKEIRFGESSVQVKANNVFAGLQVVLALPPKLWAENIKFEPALPSDILHVSRKTHTWMEDSIKIALTYKTDFWTDEKIPSTFFSNAGPITEFYDHCNADRTKFALCGFINSSFKNFSKEDRKKAVITQLTEVFGPKAKEFLEYEERVWSDERYTYKNSGFAVFPHQNNGNIIFQNTYFNGRLYISGSETAADFPGYMDGAVRAANETANKLLKFINQ